MDQWKEKISTNFINFVLKMLDKYNDKIKLDLTDQLKFNAFISMSPIDQIQALQEGQGYPFIGWPAHKIDVFLSETQDPKKKMWVDIYNSALPEERNLLCRYLEYIGKFLETCQKQEQEH